jgi:hypothetical protein
MYTWDWNIWQKKKEEKCDLVLDKDEEDKIYA